MPCFERKNQSRTLSSFLRHPTRQFDAMPFLIMLNQADLTSQASHQNRGVSKTE